MDGNSQKRILSRSFYGLLLPGKAAGNTLKTVKNWQKKPSW